MWPVVSTALAYLNTRMLQTITLCVNDTPVLGPKEFRIVASPHSSCYPEHCRQVIKELEVIDIDQFSSKRSPFPLFINCASLRCQIEALIISVWGIQVGRCDRYEDRGHSQLQRLGGYGGYRRSQSSDHEPIIYRYSTEVSNYWKHAESWVSILGTMLSISTCWTFRIQNCVCSVSAVSLLAHKSTNAIYNYGAFAIFVYSARWCWIKAYIAKPHYQEYLPLEISGTESIVRISV